MGEELSKPKTSSYNNLVEQMKLYGIGDRQARIQIDAVIEEAMENAASTGADFEKVRSIVGMHSVMLHDLKEKVQSLVALSDLDYEPVKAWEILSMLREWAAGIEEGNK
jgi:hypothetical protein